MSPIHFTGDFCTIWPYARGYYERDMPYKLWTLLEAEGPKTWEQIFWDDPYADDPTEVPRFGDLVDWMLFMFRQDRTWLIVQANNTKEICGLIWYEKSPDKELPHGNIWIARQYRGGGYARDAVRLGCEYAFGAMGWDGLYTATPWPVARNLVRRCGWRALPDIPAPKVVMGKPVTIYPSIIMKEDFYGQRKE